MLLIGVCGIAGAAIFIWYWILVMMWTYASACRKGANHVLWTAAALIFNLAAPIVLYLYGAFMGTCSECGCIRHRGEMFCTRCGHSFGKKCPDCGQELGADAHFCSKCGKKMEEL